MEASLDELVYRLLDDVALCGERGASTEEVLRFLTQHASQLSSSEENVSGAWRIDYAFQAQVWRWLTKHPDVKVGKDGRAKQWGLAAVQAHNLRLAPKSKDKTTNTQEATSPSGIQDESLGTFKATNIALSADHVLGSNDGDASQVPYIKLYACDDRLWWAAAGHGPDHEKIPPNFFTCLSIIASFREKGIPQPELVRLSGQDNRSVPKRTQTLHEQGYIEKKPTFFGGHRTSQCILKRFATSFSMEKNFAAIVETGQRRPTEPDEPKSSNSGQSTYVGMIQYRDRIEKMFELLKGNPIFGWNDLKKEVCVYKNWFQSRVLAVAVRRWEYYGVVKRARAIPSYDTVGGDVCQCVQLLRLPEENDWLLFYKFESLYKLDYPFKEGDGSDDDNGDEPERSHNLQTDSTMIAEGEEDDFAGFQAPPPFWKPNQPFGQFLYDAVSFGGTDGMSTMELKELALGSFFERPLEHALTRLEDSWQISQPLHLRHLAVVRDIATVSRTPHYVHFTFSNFKIKVERGDVEWEAVETVKPDKAKGGERLTAMADLDEFGFPVLNDQKFTGRQRCATLAQCVEADKRTLIFLKGQDPVVVNRPDGTFDVSWENNPYPKMTYEPGAKRAKVMDANVEPTPYVERRGGRRIPNPRSDLHYFPSRFAHTRILFNLQPPPKRAPPNKSQNPPLVRTFVSLSGISGWHDKDKPKPRGRPPKALKQQVKKAKPTIATMDAGNDIGDPLQGLSAGALKPGKRDAAAAQLGNGAGRLNRRRKDDSFPMRYLPSTYAHTTPLLRPNVNSDMTASKRSTPMQTRKPTARKPRILSENTKETEILSYEEQAKAMKCEIAGCYIGKSVKLRRTGGRGRAPNSRLAIFKSSRLGQFGWFSQDARSSNPNKNVGSSHVSRRKVPLLDDKSHQRTPQQPSESRSRNTSRNEVQAPLTGLAQQALTLPQETIAQPYLPTIPYGESPLAVQSAYASPYASHQIAHSLPFTPMNYFRPYASDYMSVTYGFPQARTPVAQQYPFTHGFPEASTPVAQQYPYAPTASYSTYLGPYAPTAVSYPNRGHDHGLPTLPPAFNSQYQPLQRSEVIPAAERASPSLNMRVSSKRPYDSSVSEVSVQDVTGNGDISTTPPLKKRRINSVAEEVSTSGQSQDSASMILILKGLSPTRYRRLLQAIAGTHDSKPIANLPEMAASLDEEPLEICSLPSNLEGTDEVYTPTLGVPSTPSPDAQIPVVESISIQEKSPVSDDIQELVPTSIEDFMEPEALPKMRVPSPSRTLSSPDQRQLLVVDEDNDDVESFHTRLNPQHDPTHKEASGPDPDTQSVSSEQSFATARSRIHLSCSNSDKANCSQKETDIIQTDMRNEGELYSRGPLPQLSFAAESATAIDGDSIAQEGALIGSASSPENDLNEPIAKIIQSEPTVMDQTLGLPGQHNSPEHNGLITASTASETNTMEAEPVGFEVDRVSGAEKVVVVESNLDSTTHQGLEERDLPETEVADMIESMPQSTEPQPNRLPKPFSNQQVIASGGSVGVLRRKIIMSILEEAGGLYPSGTEIWFPFMAVWLTKGITSKPDNRTIRYAAKALIDSGKVRQLTFTFKSKNGVTVKKRILMLSHISTSDPKVVELKRHIIDKYPQCHFPPKPEIPSALKKGLTGQDLLDQMAGEENLPTIQELDQKRAEDRAIREQMERERKERKAEWKNSVAEQREVHAQEHAAEKRLDKLLSGQFPAVPGPSRSISNWQMLSPSTWSSQHNAYAPRSKSNANHQAELARLRIAMSDEERYKMLDAMSPYSPTQGTSDDKIVPPKPTKLRTKKTTQLTKDFADQRVEQIVSLGPENAGLGIASPGHESTGNVDLSNEILRNGNPVNQEEDSNLASAQVKKSKRALIEIMPHDLDSMLSQCSPPSLPPVREKMSELARFDNIVDRVLYWELGTDLAPTVDCNTMGFINHEYLGLHKLAGCPRPGPFDFFNVFKDHENVWKDLARIRIPRALRVDFHIPKVPEPCTPKKISPQKRKVQKEAESPKPKRQRMEKPQSSAQSKSVHRLSLLKEQVSQLKPVENDPSTGRSFGNLRLRGSAALRYLPASEERKVVLAVIMVRTLTGGLEKNIDWPLITSIFKHRYTEVFLHQKWAYMVHKNRSLASKLHDSFQKLFVEAYEKEQVPPIDFDHLDQYDWDAVIAWSDKHLDSIYSSHQLAHHEADLPLQRSDIDDQYDLQAPVECDTAADYYELHGIATIPRRQAIAHKEPAVMLLAPYNRKRSTGVVDEVQTATNEVTVAKSWVKANIVTPINTYSSEFARSKFTLLPDPAIQSALKSLLSTKQISRENKNKYELAAAYISRLNGNISVGMLKGAAAAKMQLDDAFRHSESVAIQQTASDGHCLTMMNLLMHGKVAMHAKNQPMTEWGLVGKGQYETRKMDKKKLLYFDLEVTQTAEYENGCPLPLPLPALPLQPEQRTIQWVERICVPTSQVVSGSAVAPLAVEGDSNPQGPTPILAETRAKVTYANATQKEVIPLWYDINGSLVPELWDTCVAAVLSFVVLRPGIPLRTLCLGLRDTLEEFEVKALVQWLVDASAAQWSAESPVGRNGAEDRSKGVEPKAGWWGVLWPRAGQEVSTSRNLPRSDQVVRTMEPVEENVVAEEG